MLKLIARYTKQYKFFAILAPIFVTLESFLEMLIPLYMSKLVDNGLNKPIIIKLLICTLLSLILGISSSISAIKASCGFASNLRFELFQKIQKLPSYTIDELGTHSIITRLTKDIQKAKNTYQSLIRYTLRCPIMALLSFIMIFKISKKISIIFFIMVPLLIVLILLAIKLLLNQLYILFKLSDDLNQNIDENLKGIKVIKTYNTEKKEIKKFNTISKKITKTLQFLDTTLSSFYPLLTLLGYGCNILMIIIASKMIINKEITIGLFLSILTYSGQILGNLFECGYIISDFAMSKISIVRIFEILEKENEVDSGNITSLDNFDIEFKNVNFDYPTTHDVLKNVSFKLKQGESLGIIGATGSGKTSLVNLLVRLYNTTSGSITIGNKNISDINLNYLRDIVSIVSQNNTLFKGNIYSNMQLANSDLDDEKILEAIKGVRAQNFISSLDQTVEQYGSNFSGGQKQRLYIARSLLKYSPILILDDSTSAIDTKTDRDIKNFLKGKNCTKIIISQKISSVLTCDRVMVLDNGMIQDIDTNENLLHNNEIYKEFYNIQKGGNFDEE
ncbi:ABC transporter ATP-binding protein [Sneathia vaginalis]|uniref:ABC transporter ATP-binding protein n=1 Tax=Sneathia vaginalis TaxID=187101 RepID=UPI00370DCCC7